MAKGKKRVNIHDHMADKTGLASIYAKDGAFYSAARILRELAADVEDHAKWCDPALDASKTKQRA